MPPKKGTKAGGCSKKKRVSEDDENLPAIDVQYNPDIIDGLLQELQKQMEMKSAQVQKDADFMVTSIQQAFHLELIKLPNQVKQMPLSRFKEEFGDSLEAVTRGAMGGVVGGPLSNRTNVPTSGASSKASGTSATNPFATASKTTKAQSKVFETPAGSKNGNGSAQLISTAMRHPREGEKIVSANGSPLGDFKTVVKAPKPNGSLIVPPTPSVLVPLDSGDVLDMDSIDVSTLSKGTKEDALMKMQAMMNSIQVAMTRINGAK